LNYWFYLNTKLRDFVPRLASKARFSQQLLVLMDHPYCAPMIQALMQASAYRIEKSTLAGDGPIWNIFIAELDAIDTGDRLRTSGNPDLSAVGFFCLPMLQ
jgi:hypothetical protein